VQKTHWITDKMTSKLDNLIDGLLRDQREKWDELKMIIN